MKSKKQLLEMISLIEESRRAYFLDLFQYVPEAFIEELAYVKVKKEEYIVLAGDSCDTVYFLLQGNAAGLEYQKMGHVYSFMDFTQMYVIGDFEVFAGCLEYTASIQAIDDCRLLKVSANSYLRWIKQDENALFLRMRKIMSTLNHERQIEREFLFMTCKERLIRYLVKYYEKVSTEKIRKIRVEKTQMELASNIGYNIRSVQRSVAFLEKQELISNESGKIVISYPQYLRLNEYIDEKGKEEK